VRAGFNGMIDEISLYSRALSQAEIQAILAAYRGKCPIGPGIRVQPVNQTVNRGDTATFTVVATGTQPLSYRWYFNGSAIAAAIGVSLALTNVQTANAGNYLVVITNVAGAVTSSVASLTVNLPPLITAQPTSM